MAKGDKVKNSKLGYDPLAWLDGDADVASTSAESEVATVDEEATPAPVEDRQEQSGSEPMPQTADETASQQQQGSWQLPEYFGIAQVAEVKQSLAQILAEADGSIEIDAEHVQTVDTAGIQLLLSFVTAAAEAGKQVSFVNCSEKLEKVMSLLDVRRILIRD